MKKILFTFAALVFTLITLKAQQAEICNNGIDDDGDGFVDCFDSDCTETAECEGFYLGNDASCEAEPSELPAFKLKFAYSSDDDVVNNLSRISIGDLDSDGIPEIITQNRYTKRIFLLNGIDGSVKKSVVGNSGTVLWRSAIANVKGDNCAWVYTVEGNKVVAYDCELVKQWASENTGDERFNIGFADFDGDGQAELYYKDEIRDPITGVRLARGDRANWDKTGDGSVAVDIKGDEDLELVLNDKIYRVNTSASRTQDSWSLTKIDDANIGYKLKGGNSESATTSVADYNLDGFLDVIFTGADENNYTTVFFWDVENETTKEYTYTESIANYGKGWHNGTGRINIGDLDGDGQLNAVFVSGKYVHALDENWELLWSKEVF